MTLSSYLLNHTLITNLYDIQIDYQTLKKRFLYRYAKRLIRDDVEVDEISDIAQNVIDTNKDFLTNLFSQSINPFATIREQTKSTDNSTTTTVSSYNNKDDTSTANDSKTTNSGTVTTTVSNTNNGSITNEGTSTDTNKPNTTTTHSVYAYDNITTPSPESMDTQSGEDVRKQDATNTTTSNDTQSGESAETRDTADTTSQTGETHKTYSGNSNDDTRTKSDANTTRDVFEFDKFTQTLRAPINLYDFVINLIAPEILITVATL